MAVAGLDRPAPTSAEDKPAPTPAEAKPAEESSSSSCESSTEESLLTVVSFAPTDAALLRDVLSRSSS